MKWNGSSAVALLSSLGACLIDQNPAHEARGKAVEVFAILKTKTALPDQLQEQLIDYAGRLQQILRPLPAKK